MIRILQCVNNMNRAGLETMLMNYYRNIDRTKIQFDFLTHRPVEGDYDEEIISMGGRVYYAPRLYPQNYCRYFKYMKKFYEEHSEYVIVHSHIDSMSYLPLLAAKKSKVPIRIAHSHNTSLDKDFKYFLKQFFRININSVATHRLACGKKAGEFLFGNNSFKVINNAIECDRFLYNENVRVDKRAELGLKDSFVVGHIGRISYQKNHRFLIEIFKEIAKKKENAVLLLVGDGEKKREIINQITAEGLSDRVRLLGKRKDVDSLYQAMDVFVMPSFFEGIPVVGIEAQCSGLPCVFSDRVPSEVKISDSVDFLSLKLTGEVWAEKIIETAETHTHRAISDFNNSGYNIKNACEDLKDYYLELYAHI